MLTIGVDPHKQTHTAAVLDELGVEVSVMTARADRDGFMVLLAWARSHQRDRLWVIEDCRHVSGPLERFLLDCGEPVCRLAPHLMAGARRSVRERGKSDPIDAVAIARAALREGLDTLPTAHLAGAELEIRQLTVHRDRLVAARTRLINDLRWRLHDLWPELEIPKRVLILPKWQQSTRRRLARAQPTAQVRVGRDEITRIIELTRTINALHDELAGLVRDTAPDLLAHQGLGVVTAAKLISEIAGIERFATDAQLARMAGCAPVPVSSGRTDRHRLDRGGNRQLNHAVHMLALCRIRHDPQTAVYLAKQRARGKTTKEAIRNLKRHLIRLIYRTLKAPNSTPTPIYLT